MNTKYLSTNSVHTFDLAGLFTLSLRLVAGWTYFSAFWRRLVLENKLDPESAGYIGEKFNNFLPNALGIQPMIEYMVSNPEVLWWSMTVFTIVEGIVGLLFMFGLFTRLMSVGVFGLAMGILLGAGWIGTTCLDEWQIGILGIAAGFTIFLSGGGSFSLDGYLRKKYNAVTRKAWFPWIGSGFLPVSASVLRNIAIVGAGFMMFATLFTNQYFHGGVWGTLHNKSVKPKIEIHDAVATENGLEFTIYRVEGVDVYGSFLIGIDVYDQFDNSVISYNGDQLASFPLELIANRYVAKVKPGEHSLIVPLGAKARLKLPGSLESGTFKLVLTDISGAKWEVKVSL